MALKTKRTGQAQLAAAESGGGGGGGPERGLHARWQRSDGEGCSDESDESEGGSWGSVDNVGLPRPCPLPSQNRGSRALAARRE
jgi:hypothetical protein